MNQKNKLTLEDIFDKVNSTEGYRAQLGTYAVLRRRYCDQHHISEEDFDKRYQLYRIEEFNRESQRKGL